MSEPNDWNFFLLLDGPSFDELLEAFTPTVAKRSSDVWKAVAPVSVYPLRYTLWQWKYFWRREIHKSWVKWNYCAEDMVVDGRQTVTESLLRIFVHWLLSLLFCLAQFIVWDCELCNPSILKQQGQEYYGIINIAQCYWPSKDALSLHRCLLLDLTHEYKVQTPSAIRFVRLFAVS
jgi:hypothetical protein